MVCQALEESQSHTPRHLPLHTHARVCGTAWALGGHQHSPPGARDWLCLIAVRWERLLLCTLSSPGARGAPSWGEVGRPGRCPSGGKQRLKGGRGTASPGNGLSRPGCLQHSCLRGLSPPRPGCNLPVCSPLGRPPPPSGLVCVPGPQCLPQPRVHLGAAFYGQSARHIALSSSLWVSPSPV